MGHDARPDGKTAQNFYSLAVASARRYGLRLVAIAIDEEDYCVAPHRLQGRDRNGDRRRLLVERDLGIEELAGCPTRVCIVDDDADG